MPTTSTYTLIKDTIPIAHSSHCGLIWDPVLPKLYLSSGPNIYNYGNGGAYMYRYDRQQKNLDLAAQTINNFSPFGSPTLDRNGRLYYSPPGGTTFTIQQSASFKSLDVTVIARAEQKIGTSSCGVVTMISGDYFTDQYVTGGYWWHMTNSDLATGTITCFHKDKFCDLTNANSKAPLLVYSVPQTAFLSLGGFASRGFKVRAATADPGGILWVFASGPDDANRNRYGIWRVGLDGIPKFEYEFTSVIEAFGPGAQNVSQGRMRWFGDDGTLIISTGRVYVKYAPGGNVTHSLFVASASPGAWDGSTHLGSFRHPDTRVPSLWVANVELRTSVPVPSGGFSLFPRFTEIRMSDLTIAQILVSQEIGVDYPIDTGPNPVDGAPRSFSFFSPTDVIYDPDAGELWATSSTQRWIGVFRFASVPIIPPPGGPPPPPVGQAPYCVPKNANFSPFTGR